MSPKTNAHQLVLRKDSATGFVKAGWAAEMPLGRFIHIDIICEFQDCTPITADFEFYDDYQIACKKACSLNRALLREEEMNYRAKGWLPVPLDLNNPTINTEPDEFGCYQTIAMQTLFRLTANFTEVWAVVDQKTVLQIKTRHPPRHMEELEYQVWKLHALKLLSQYPGDIIVGKLIVRESGLWFRPDKGVD